MEAPPISPLLGDSGTTAYRAMDRSRRAVDGVEFSSMFTLQQGH